MKRLLSLLLCAVMLLCLAPQAFAAAPKYDNWREAYAALLTDEKARAAAIGDAADYRESYFAPEALTPTAYAAADLNADGTPELLLYAEGTGLTDVFTFDGGLRYLGYDMIYGFLPESGSMVVHGHWHGAGGSGDKEWSAVPLFTEDRGLSVYLDCMESEGRRRYSFQENGGYSDSAWLKIGEDKAEAERYEELYKKYVLACVRMEDVPFFTLDNFSGFVSPCDLKLMRRLYNAVGTFPYTCGDFLREKRWEGINLLIRSETPLRALLFDMDGDGVSELLLSNGSKKASERASWIFRYDALNDRMVCLGAGPYDAVTGGGALYGCKTGGGKVVWTEYSKGLNSIRTRTLEEYVVGYLEKYAKLTPLKWLSPEDLAAQLAKQAAGE